jgi:predicted RNA-binding Zn-ribbon protein involved in translation (DUF1610 family)
VDKYGVEEVEPKDKTANDKATCPTCGKILRPQTDTGVLLCPSCGSAPFEAPAEKK